MRLLYVSYGIGRPFIEDTARELVKKGYVISQFVVSQDKLINYNTLEETRLSTSEKNNWYTPIKSFLKILKKHKFELIHFHLIHPIYLLFLIINLKNRVPTLSTVWGSDYYLASGISGVFKRFVYQITDRIAFTNPYTKINFDKKNPNLAHKTEVMSFGLTKLDIIQQLKSEESIEHMKEQVELPSTKKVICIGYNASTHQNHLEILEGLGKSDLKSEEYFLLLPLSYGGTDEYVKRIESSLKKMPFEYKILNTFLSDQDICRVRLCTDIFIQVQTSDQFSGAMQEALFAGSQVITGTWLPYDLFIEKGIDFTLVDRPFAVGQKISEIKDQNIAKSKNAEIIYGLSGWENIIPKWENTYKNLLK